MVIDLDTKKWPNAASGDPSLYYKVDISFYSMSDGLLSPILAENISIFRSLEHTNLSNFLIMLVSIQGNDSLFCFILHVYNSFFDFVPQPSKENVLSSHTTIYNKSVTRVFFLDFSSFCILVLIRFGLVGI